jgi:hypothetical protein
MNAVLARQYTIVLSAIDRKEPSDYLSFLEDISQSSIEKFDVESFAFVPYPVNDLIDELEKEGLVAIGTRYKLTAIGKKFLEKAEVASAA